MSFAIHIYGVRNLVNASVHILKLILTKLVTQSPSKSHNSHAKCILDFKTFFSMSVMFDIEIRHQISLMILKMEISPTPSSDVDRVI